MAELLDKLGFLLLGALVTYVVQRILHERHEKSKVIKTGKIAFRGLPESHLFLFRGLTKELWEAKIPPELREQYLTVVYFLVSTGRGVINDLRLRLRVPPHGNILSYQFQVEHEIICGRLDERRKDQNTVEVNWKYLNPGDVIDLHVFVDGITDPSQVELEVDGEGVTVKKGVFLTRCVMMTASAAQPPLTAQRTAVPPP
jgi:hypothetical protein